MKIPKKAAFLLAVAAGTCWGTHGSFATLMGSYGVSDDTIALVAPLFYGLFFLVLLVKDDIRHLKFSGKLLPVILLYGACSALYSYSIMKAYWHMPVGIVHTVIFSSLFLLIIVSRILFKDPLTWQKIVSSILAVLGIALLLDVFGESTWSMLGLIWTGLALISWTGLVTIEKYLLESDLDGNAIMVYSAFFAILFLLPIVSPIRAVTEIAVSVASSGGMVLLPLLGFAVITSVGAYYFYLEALKRLEPAYVQLGYVMDPLFASVLGFFLFGQAFSPVQICGMVLILAVVVWVEVEEIRKNRKAESA